VAQGHAGRAEHTAKVVAIDAARFSQNRPNVVPLDRVRIEQALANLLVNAVTYSPPGAEVVVGCAPDPSGPETLVLEVADRWPGVPGSEREASSNRFTGAPGPAVLAQGCAWRPCGQPRRLTRGASPWRIAEAAERSSACDSQLRHAEQRQRGRRFVARPIRCYTKSGNSTGTRTVERARLPPLDFALPRIGLGGTAGENHHNVCAGRPLRHFMAQGRGIVELLGGCSPLVPVMARHNSPSSDWLHGASRPLLSAPVPSATQLRGLPQSRYRSRVAGSEPPRGIFRSVELLGEAERLYFGDFSSNVRPIGAVRARMWVAQGQLSEAWGWAPAVMRRDARGRRHLATVPWRAWSSSVLGYGHLTD